MPIPPPPFTFHCPTYHWSLTVIPRSDALVQGVDWFECCPQCHGQPLQRRPATPIEILATRLRRIFGATP